MPLIIRKPRDVLVFRSGVASTARSLNDVVEQLQAQVKQLQDQLQAEREQHTFNCNQYEETIRNANPKDADLRINLQTLIRYK